jgi:hypothetical protein
MLEDGFVPSLHMCPCSDEEDFKIEGLEYKHYLKTLQFPGRLYFDRLGKEGAHTKTYGEII